MPYKRAISPFSLETYELSADDITSDELPASDDELTEAERAAKRQRIEKLAESYLQGQPLFILSASLKGPFEQGWRNPWKKDRKAIVSRQAKKRGKRVIQNAGRVVQETDLRQPKYREDLPVAALCPPAAISRIAQSPNVQDSNASSPVTSRSAQKRPLQAAIHDDQFRATPRSIKKPKETPSWQTNDHSFSPGGPADWLKKDRRRLNFTQYEPPSSPTSEIVSRQAENKARFGSMRTMEIRPPAMASRRRISITPAVGEGTRTAERMDISPEVSRVATITQRNQDPIVEKTLASGPPSTHRSSPSVEVPVASSFRVISSTSQLPRFEYRRWHQENNSSQAGQSSPVKPISPAVMDTSVEHIAPVSGAGKIQEDLLSDKIVAEVQDAPAAGSSEIASASSAENGNSVPIDQPMVLDTPVVTEEVDDAAVEPGDPEEPNEPLEQPVEDNPKEPSEAELVQMSKDLRFAGGAALSTCIEEGNQPETEQNTYENLPSAQHVPAPPGVSDRIPSLHSTAMPRTNPGQNTEESSDTQLSTQAALLHAQRSFQEDLESPEAEFIHPAEPEDSVLGPHEESILAQETPYNGPQASQAVHQSSLRRFSKHRIQAMSTQCMIDAVTPYTFSTEKKTKAFRELSPDQPSEERSEGPPNLPSLSPRMPSPSQDHEYHTAHSSPHGPDPALTHHSTTQGSALPFAISGSTPTTAQDGQGAPPGVESFDLSQAIADAGSWLHQSFDFMKDIGRPSQPARPT